MHPRWLPFTVLMYWWHLNCVDVANSQTFPGNGINLWATSPCSTPCNHSYVSKFWVKAAGVCPHCAASCVLLGCTPSVLGAPGAHSQCRKERGGCAVAECFNTDGRGSASPALHLFTVVNPTFFLTYFFLVTRETLNHSRP